MTEYLFKKLDEIQKAELIWTQGALVAEREVAGYRLLLFQLASFYVEVYYNLEQEKFERVQSFSGTSRLKPYLDRIDISSLLYV